MSTKKELQMFYERLLRAVEIPVIETEIWSPGFYQSQGGEHRIYLKNSLPVAEKIKVVTHEYTHYLHLNKQYENESRESTEIIAEVTTYFICKQFNLGLFKEMDFEVLYATNLSKDNLLEKARSIDGLDWACKRVFNHRQFNTSYCSRTD